MMQSVNISRDFSGLSLIVNRNSSMSHSVCRGNSQSKWTRDEEIWKGTLRHGGNSIMMKMERWVSKQLQVMMSPPC